MLNTSTLKFSTMSLLLVSVVSSASPGDQLFKTVDGSVRTCSSPQDKAASSLVEKVVSVSLQESFLTEDTAEATVSVSLVKCTDKGWSVDQSPTQDKFQAYNSATGSFADVVKNYKQYELVALNEDGKIVFESGALDELAKSGTQVVQMGMTRSEVLGADKKRSSAQLELVVRVVSDLQSSSGASEEFTQKAFGSYYLLLK